MVAAIDALASEAFLRIQWEDIDGEPIIQTIALDSTVTDADVVSMVDALDALSNAKIVKASVSVARGITGTKAAAVAALRPSVYERAILTFAKTNPVNAAKESLRSVGIPAFINGIKSGSHPNLANVDLSGLTTLLEDNLDMVGADGTHYPGGWTYDNDRSGFITATSKTDGLPG